MAFIIAKNLSIVYPIYGTNARSIKSKTISKLTGGTLQSDKDSKIVHFRALDKLSFNWKEGDKIGLVGHNGSGKSTLLRTILGIFVPIHGYINVHGRISSMLSISAGLENDATGLENIYLRGKILGCNKYQIDNMTQDIVEFCDLGKFIEMPLRVYSSGMLMRLAFGIATSVNSDIILMDEWLSVGDESFAKKSEDRLNDLVKKAKILVIASHNSSLVDRVCNKIYHMHKGKFIDIKKNK